MTTLTRHNRILKSKKANLRASKKVGGIRGHGRYEKPGDGLSEALRDLLRGCGVPGCTERHPEGSICSVWGCHGKHKALGLCAGHLNRYYKYGKSGRLGPPLFKYRASGAESHAWLGDDVTYNSQHWRLRKHYGSARLYECFDCGGDALQWAYYFPAEDERYDEATGFPYCTDFDAYRPLCKSCHNRRDRWLLRQREGR